MVVNNDYRHSSEEEYRKKRVRRMKNLIIGTVFFLLIVPTICCITMMFKVYRLEKQVESLVKIHEEEYERYQKEKKASSGDNGRKVYAAEIEESKEAENLEETRETPKEPEAADTKALTPEELLEQNTENKKVYLTFDDGPSRYSNELLDILKKYNVKATFFVIGRTDRESLAVYKRIVDEGHTLAMHSYTHKYDEIYKNLDSFKKDVESLSDLLYEATGVRPKYYRFPGGSSNQVSDVPIEKCISYLNKKGITYFDWNVVNGDAGGKNYSAKKMVDTAMEGIYRNNNSMILMHDTVSRDTTVKSLPSLIKKLQKEGYVILPISDYTNTVQHVKADSIK